MKIAVGIEGDRVEEGMEERGQEGIFEPSFNLIKRKWKQERWKNYTSPHSTLYWEYMWTETNLLASVGSAHLYLIYVMILSLECNYVKSMTPVMIFSQHDTRKECCTTHKYYKLLNVMNSITNGGNNGETCCLYNMGFYGDKEMKSEEVVITSGVLNCNVW